MKHVEFVSYDGRWPNLCGGILTLKIDGVECKFGHDYHVWRSWETDGNYHSFWSSSGSCTMDPDYNYDVQTGRWNIDVEDLPEQFRKYAKEIDEEFNSNVEWGCCGGCI